MFEKIRSLSLAKRVIILLAFFVIDAFVIGIVKKDQQPFDTWAVLINGAVLALASVVLFQKELSEKKAIKRLREGYLSKFSITQKLLYTFVIYFVIAFAYDVYFSKLTLRGLVDNIALGVIISIIMAVLLKSNSDQEKKNPKVTNVKNEKLVERKTPTGQIAD